jgi:hypothetical protein
MSTAAIAVKPTALATTKVLEKIRRGGTTERAERGTSKQEPHPAARRAIL